MLCHRRSLVLMSTVLACAPAAARTDADFPPPGFSGSVGLGLISTPSYEGSPRRRLLVGPEFSLSHRSPRWGTVSLSPRGLQWQFLEVGGLALGVIAGVDAGRKSSDPSRGDPTPGDRRLAGMGEIRSSPEVGVSLTAGPFHLRALHALGNRGHRGSQLAVGAEWPLEVSGTFGVRLGAELAWADARTMQAYFGVTPAQSQASGYRATRAGAGLRRIDLGVAAEQSIARDWRVQAAWTWTRLLRDAAASPLVERASSPSLGVALVRHF